jgi:hypothetical protein
VREIVRTLPKQTPAALFYERDPAVLLARCLAELAKRRG